MKNSVSRKKKEIKCSSIMQQDINIYKLLKSEKLDVIRSLLDADRSIILALIETWLNGEFPQQLLDVDGFLCNTRDRRPPENGGSVIVYVPVYVKSQLMKMGNLEEFEVLKVTC